MQAPEINISFREIASTITNRGNRGIVVLLVKDRITALAKNPTTIYNKNDIPEYFSETTKKQIQLALIGYINPPQKVIVYCMDVLIDESGETLEIAYAKGLKSLESIKFDYLVIPTVASDNKAEDIVAWIDKMRAEKRKRCKAILPNCVADNEGIINFTTSKCTKTESQIKNGVSELTETVYTTEEYCARIAGLLAGTPLTISCTYAPLPELTDCSVSEDIDKAVDQGQLILFNDGEKVKIVRGVNSLTSDINNKGEDFRKIKIIEAMDMISNDIVKTIEDDYIGKYPNTYDNKCILVSSIKEYFAQIAKDNIIYDYSIDIDVEKQAEYLKLKGVDISGMEDEEIRMSNTGSKVYLIGSIKILDAMEDVYIPIVI